MAGQPITVVVADDHELVRQGLVRLLQDQPRVKVVGQAADGLAVVELVRRLSPQVVLMDLKMPHLDGLAATRQIVGECPGTSVVVLTVSDRDDDLLAAVMAGTKGYLLKNATVEDVLRAVEAAAAGEVLLSPAVAAKVLVQLCGAVGTRAGQHTPGAVVLSPKERETLRVLASRSGGGLEPNLAGDGTLRRHLRAVAEKLQHHRREMHECEAVRSEQPVAGQRTPSSWLSPREIAVLQLLAGGASTRTVATELCISSATARHHVENLMSKLGVHTRLEAVAYAFQRGLVQPQ